MRRLFFLFAFSVSLCGHALAESPDETEAATRRGLERVKQAASDWQTHKTCFSCHHQTLPMLAVTEAARVGFPMDETWLASQAKTTHDYFSERIEDMNNGDHVPGGSTTVGYGLWALSLAGYPADETTMAIITYLMKIQGVPRTARRPAVDVTQVENGRWTTSCRRPPMQGSDMADTVLALIGIEKYASDRQLAALEVTRTAAERWLVQAPLNTQEDRVWRLWGLHSLKGDAGVKEAVRRSIAAAQRGDGGWAASDGLESDAFSTGETLFMLCRTGSTITDTMIQRAQQYLLRTQLSDGSWLVESRVENKAQPYFENGDPHGEHQFLSTAATAWATAALAQLLPAKPD